MKPASYLNVWGLENSTAFRAPSQLAVTLRSAHGKSRRNAAMNEQTQSRGSLTVRIVRPPEAAIISSRRFDGLCALRTVMQASFRPPISSSHRSSRKPDRTLFPASDANNLTALNIHVEPERKTPVVRTSGAGIRKFVPMAPRIGSQTFATDSQPPGPSRTATRCRPDAGDQKV